MSSHRTTPNPWKSQRSLMVTLGHNSHGQEERVLRGWVHDDKNGNFKRLSSYAQLVSLMKSSLWIIGFYSAHAYRAVTVRVQLACFSKNGKCSILGYDVLEQIKKIEWVVEIRRHNFQLLISIWWIKFIILFLSCIWIMGHKSTFMSEMHPRQKFSDD